MPIPDGLISASSRQRPARAIPPSAALARSAHFTEPGMNSLHAEGSCLSSVAALAQGDGGDQRGACEQRGRQIQRVVQRAGEGRVPRLDDLV